MAEKHIMIDLETLGTRPTSIFISIGAVEFDINTGVTGREFYHNVDVASSVLFKRTTDASTLKWWEKQGEEPKKVLYKNEVSLTTALADLHAFIKSLGGTKVVWANSPSFDLVMLTSAFEMVDLSTPWQFWNTRDCRTMGAIGAAIGIPKTHEVFNFDGTKHYALDDAKHQAKYVSFIYNELNKEK